mmetsp:Transcript_29470/g.57733  ORF Transcript_29470/g.57733 Transcript_29470/m.57733 type:complete len:214 (+) Transcript_29470:395-1036(+)
MGLGPCARRITLDKAPKDFLRLRLADRRKVQQHRKGHHHIALGHIARMDMPHRVVQAGHIILFGIGTQLLVILVHGFGDHVKKHALGRLWLLIHKVRQALGRGIGQPLVNADTIARGFGNLLALVVQKQLIAEVVRGLHAKGPTNRVIDFLVGGMFLAIHLKIHAQGRPTGAKIRLPLQFHIAACDRQGHLDPIRIVKGHSASRRIHMLHRHI